MKVAVRDLSCLYKNGDLLIENKSGCIVWVFVYDSDGNYIPPYTSYTAAILKIPVSEGYTYKLNLFKSTLGSKMHLLIKLAIGFKSLIITFRPNKTPSIANPP